MTGLLRKVVGWEEELLGMEMEVRNAWFAANSGIFCVWNRDLQEWRVWVECREVGFM